MRGDSDRAVHAAITRALLQLGRRLDWRDANQYLQHHLPSHAMLGAVTDELVADSNALDHLEQSQLAGELLRAFFTDGALSAPAEACLRARHVLLTTPPPDRPAVRALAHAVGSANVTSKPVGAHWWPRWIRSQYEPLHIVLPGYVTYSAQALAFPADGRTLASAGDGTVRLWRLPTAIQQAEQNAPTPGLTAVAFSPDGRTIASVAGGGDATIHLWDAASGRPNGQPLRDHDNPAKVGALAFSPDGRTLAAACSDRKVQLWDVNSGTQQIVRTGLNRDIKPAVAFSPDGGTLAAATYAGVQLFEVATGRVQAMIYAHTNMVWAVVFSPDGRMLATAVDHGTVRLLEVATHTERAAINGHGEFALTVAFSPDGRILASGGSDGKVRLSDVTTGTLRSTLSGHGKEVRALAFSPDGRILASASQDGTVRLWMMTTVMMQRRLMSAHPGGVTAMAVTSNGRTLADAAANGTARLWDVATGRQRSAISHDGKLVRAVAFSPDGQTLATASGINLRLWDVATVRERLAITDTIDTASELAFSPDGCILAASGRGHSVRLWDLYTGTVEVLHGQYGASKALDFSPDGCTLAVESGGCIALWDFPTSRLLRQLYHPEHTGLRRFAFSPDGRTLAGAGYIDVFLWDVSTGELRAPLSGYVTDIRTIAFHSDGRTLVAAGSNGVQHWNTEKPDAAPIVQPIRNLAQVHEMCLLPDGGLAVGTQQGVSVLDIL